MNANIYHGHAEYLKLFQYMFEFVVILFNFLGHESIEFTKPLSIPYTCTIRVYTDFALFKKKKKTIRIIHNILSDGEVKGSRSHFC